MPYIGNSHQVGDHINNFKVLDDISSYTATFDGSSSSVVSTTDETIRILEHRFIQGQRVTYNNGGGSNIGGLSSGTAYYVSFNSANTIKLATSLANANDGTLINFSSVGGGISHTLTAAFDGTNTKFKLTHNNGDSGRFNNATQLQVAINNVLQRPNQNPNNFTEGFAVESGNKIVFKTAPTSNDVFWGSIIANTLPTFDISDNKIDNFTGDGSTTEFNLSHIPANNQSLMVSINGVLQHPSSSSTERSYTLIANVIQFTSAPANGDEIQVRHIGFRGATSSSVTGFYGRTGNVVLTSSDHITTGDIIPRNINTTGIITATSFIGSGANLTGIDATAVKDTSGNVKIQAQASGAVYTGIHTFTTLKSTSADFSGNVSIAGTLTYEDVKNVDSVGLGTFREGIFLPDGKKALFGNAASNGDLEIYHSGSHSYIQNKTNFLFIHSNSLALRSLSQETFVDCSLNGSVDLYYDNSKKIETTSTGINVTGNVVSDGLVVDGNSDLNGDLDVDGHTNLDNISIAGVSTFSNDVRLPDNKYLQIGNSQDLQLYHNGSHSYIKDNGTGRLIIQSSQLCLQDTSGYNHIINNPGADVQLYYDFNNHSTPKLKTTATGVTIDGTAVATGADINGDLDVDGHTNLDNVSIAGISTATGGSVFGLIQAGVGALNATIQKTDNGTLHLQYNKSGNLELCQGGGLVKVFNNFRVVGLSTMTGGAKLGNLSVGYDNLNATIQPVSGQNTLHFNYNNGTEVRIGEGQTRSDLIVKGDVEPKTDSAFDLGTTSVRWRNIYADTLYGDGSNLSNVISGVDLKFEGASVGTGVTMLNFVGFNTVTAPVSGLSTITSGQNLTIGVRSGSAVEASLTGTSFNVIARSGGNISINI